MSRDQREGAVVELHDDALERRCIAGSISSRRSTIGWSGPSSWPDAMRNRRE